MDVGIQRINTERSKRVLLEKFFGYLMTRNISTDFSNMCVVYTQRIKHSKRIHVCN